MHVLPRPFAAKFVRIVAAPGSGTTPALNVELYGCPLTSQQRQAWFSELTYSML